MVSEEIKEYIIQVAKRAQCALPENYIEILEEYVVQVKTLGYKLIFEAKGHKRPDGLHAVSGYKTISVTPGWAAQLVLHNTADTNNAFMIMIGHEMSHDDNTGLPVWTYIFLIPYWKFLRHVREVYCDFSGTRKIGNSSREIFVKSIDYKIDFKKRILEADISDFTHPSWERRRYYAENFDFGEKLIRQIAKDVKCRNQWLINSVIRSYDEIILINNTKGDTN